MEVELLDDRRGVPNSIIDYRLQLDAGPFLELLENQIGLRPYANVTVIEFVWACLGDIDQFRQLFDRNAVCYGQNVIISTDQRDRRNIRDPVSGVMIDERIDRVEIGTDQQGVTVRRL